MLTPSILNPSAPRLSHQCMKSHTASRTWHCASSGRVARKGRGGGSTRRFARPNSTRIGTCQQQSTQACDLNDKRDQDHLPSKHRHPITARPPFAFRAVLGWTPDIPGSLGVVFDILSCEPHVLRPSSLNYAVKDSTAGSPAETDLITGMVDDKIHDQLHTPLMDLFSQLVPVFLRAVTGIDVPVVRDVVPHIR